MKVMLTGANGFVGQRIRTCVQAVAAPSLRDASEEAVKRLVGELAPDVIIHTAAISDIGTCERDPEASRRANVLLPVWLAKAAPGCKLVMYSTDQVYSGAESDGPYPEGVAKPANTYARHKLEMEQRVLEIAPDAVMLRATWMYDMPMYGAQNRGNFLVNLLEAAAMGREIAFSAEQHRDITYVREAAEMTIRAMQLPGGVYNFGSRNPDTIYETAAFLADALGLHVRLKKGEVRHHLWMDYGKLAAQGLALPTAQEGLMRCIRDYALV